MAIRNSLLVILLSFATILCCRGSAYAFTSQEDPDSAQPVYDGISLFNYYSDILDAIIVKNPENVRGKTADIPFANLPETVSNTARSLSDYLVSIADSIANTDEAMNRLAVLVGQSQLDDAAVVKSAILRGIASEETTLSQIQNAFSTIGDAFRVASTPPDSQLRAAFGRVTDRISKIRDLLQANKRMAGSTDVSRPLMPTEVSLVISRESAYVGEAVTISGMLQSKGGPLSGREISVLVDRSTVMTAVTDTSGNYHCVLDIPYIYTPQIDIQSVYYPSGGDLGVYLASGSQEINFAVLYYAATLSIRLPPIAYPGLVSTVSGTFDYGDGPQLSQRNVEVYMDNVLLVISACGPEFSLDIKLDEMTTTENHTITIASPSVGRYAPANVGAVLLVIKAVPVVDVRISPISFLPGKLHVTGSLKSTAGPLQNAAVSLTINKTSAEVSSDGQGIFDANIRMNYGLELLGSQSLIIQIKPKEPWNAPVVTSKKVFLIETINCSVFLGLLAFFGVFMSRRIRTTFRVHDRQRAAPVISPVRQDTGPEYPAAASLNVAAGQEDESEPRYLIFSWYAAVLKQIQKSTRIVIQPWQTLREFAENNRMKLGPAASHFLELTKIVESLLYSRTGITEEQLNEGRRLSGKVQQGLR